MGARYLTDLADVLRAAGLTVIEVDGWGNRARSSGGYDGTRPWCVMWHHTASSTSPENDVSYIVHGCPDAPVSNLYLARDGTVWVCAAGATNTNGKGKALAMSQGVVPADQMNTHAIGIEAANNGLGEPWPQVQIDAYFTVSNALTAAYGMRPDDVATHHEYAADRKIDPATAAAVQGPWRPDPVTTSGTWSLADIWDECWLRSTGLPPTPIPPEPEPSEEDKMYQYLIDESEQRWAGDMMVVRWITTAWSDEYYRGQLSERGLPATPFEVSRQAIMAGEFGMVIGTPPPW